MTHHYCSDVDPPVTTTPPTPSSIARLVRHSIMGSVWMVAAHAAVEVHAQVTVTELQSPYSFISSQTGKEYFISNVNGDPEKADNNGFITKLDAGGKILGLKFIEGGRDNITLHAPKGMALVDRVLYVADLDTVRGFDATTGRSTAAIRLSDGAASGSSRVSLTDIAFDGKGLLYGSDQRANRIYRIDLASQTASVLIADTALSGPAGLAVHPKSGHVIVVSWDKGKIFDIAPDGALTELVSNGFFSGRFKNLRGIDFDRWGNMYVSDFTTGKVWRMTWDKRFQVIAEYLPSPGDLGIDRTNNLILVPYESADAAEMNGLETPSDGTRKEKRTLADYGFIPPPPKPGTEGAPKK
jgi:DNA-binding beta-propeller fold protein YncE